MGASIFLASIGIAKGSVEPKRWPNLDKTVVYEANLRAFGPKPGFKALTSRLSSLKQLGVTVLWLMPVQPVGKVRSAGGLGSPYALANFVKVNPEFGTEADLRALIKTAHTLGLKVILDWVADHTAWDHPWIAEHPDWYLKDRSGSIEVPPGTNWNDVAALDYGQPQLRQTMAKSMKHWLEAFNIDGFRCDASDRMPSSFWKATILELRSSVTKPLLMLAEGYRPEDYEAGFDLTYGWHFYDRLAAIYKGAKASSLFGAEREEAEGVPNGARRLRFTTNHDKDAWEGTPNEFFNGEAGAQSAFAVTALYGGTPLIYTGQEVGWPSKIPIFEGSQIDWSKGLKSYQFITSIMNFRNLHPAARKGALTDLSDNNVIAFERRLRSDQILVVANVRNEVVEFNLPPKLGAKLVSQFGKSRRLAPFELFITAAPR